MIGGIMRVHLFDDARRGDAGAEIVDRLVIVGLRAQQRCRTKAHEQKRQNV
jgi:hypothetical protein